MSLTLTGTVTTAPGDCSPKPSMGGSETMPGAAAPTASTKPPPTRSGEASTVALESA